MIELRNYQHEIAKRAAECLDEHGCCYLSMECRTGKTLTALYAASLFNAMSVLFVTKIKAIPSVKHDYSLLDAHFSLQVVNYESLHKVSGEFDLVICDEAHTLGAYPKPSKKTSALKALAEGLPVLYLSGTPSPESYSQLYHQFWVCSFSPFKQYANFYKWANVYVDKRQKKVNGYLITDYSKAKKRLIDNVTRDLFISYSQDEAGFTSNVVERSLSVKMDDGTAQVFKALRRDRVVNVGGHNIVGDTPAKLLNKLHQLSGGTVIAEDGAHLILDRSKAKFVKERFAGKKIAIFFCYQSELDLLTDEFPEWTDSPEEFQQSKDKVFISQVRRAREGVRLDSADALVFFNLEYSYLSYEQGKNRLVSKERTEPANIYFLCSDFGIESEILNAVHDKKDFTLSYYRGKCARQLTIYD